MPVISGKVTTFGSVAYVSQEAWVISDTVRENILLGATRNANDHEHYNEVLETCELSHVRKFAFFLSIGVNFFQTVHHSLAVRRDKFFTVISPYYKRHNTVDAFPRVSNHMALSTCDYIVLSPARQIGACRIYRQCLRLI